MEAKLHEILIRAKKDVFGKSSGDNLTKLQGDGLDFREIKEYSFGDDVKKINWKATAKSGDIKVNLFNIDRELNIVIIYLASGSLYFGTKRLKNEVATEIIATLAYSALKNNNRLASLIFSQKEEKFFPPTKQMGATYQISQEVFNTKLLQKSIDYKALCEYINTTYKEKALIFLVGDFYGESIDLSSIAYKHELYALIVRDRFEEFPYIEGEYEFVSPINSNHTEVLMNRSAAKKYAKLLKEQDTKILQEFSKHGIKHGKIYTDEDIYLRLTQTIH